MISVELNVTTRTERELLVEATYQIHGTTPVILRADVRYQDHPLTAFEWEQIEAAVDDHCAHVLAELRDEECPAERRAA